MSKYYVYIHTYPDGRVFYVGKGTGDRINAHVREAMNGGQSLKCSIIRHILGCGEQVERSIVYETGVERDALLYEWILINLVYGIANLANEHTFNAPSHSQGSGTQKHARSHITKQMKVGEMPRKWLKYKGVQYEISTLISNHKEYRQIVFHSSSPLKSEIYEELKRIHEIEDRPNYWRSATSSIRQ